MASLPNTPGLRIFLGVLWLLRHYGVFIQNGSCVIAAKHTMTREVDARMGAVRIN